MTMQNTMPIVPDDQAGSDTCLPVGTRLADFEITGVIGEGGFGIVYLAFDHSLQRTVAIKEYMPGTLARRGADKSVAVRLQREQKTFDAGLKSFINEARLLAQFDHPALVKVYRFWEENKTGYMAMRYYDGLTVKGVVKQHPALVTEAWLKGMLKPVLEALEALYRVKVLHRDISPDNIMIQNGGDAVLLDFGAARQIIGDMNRAVTVILKPGYAPIEQYANDAGMTQGPWTDIYSLSAVVYFAIAGEAPPTSVARMIKDPVERLQDGQCQGYSKEFLEAIDKGLAVKPEDRPQSIEEFRQLLQLELSVPAPTPGAAMAPPLPGFPVPAIGQASKKSSKAVVALSIALSIAALLSVLGIAAYFSFRQAAPSTGLAQDRVPPAHAADREKAMLAAAATTTVRFNIKPWGTVFVDGVDQGVSPPLKKLELAAGKHRIRIENPRFPSHTIDIDVTKKTTGIIEHDFSPHMQRTRR